MPHASQHDPASTASIQACLACYRTCTEIAFQHCLQLGGPHVEAGHFRLMADCAEICHMAAAMMLRGSAFHGRSCALCAEICHACARSCEEVGDMEECVAVCQSCAAHCARMAQA